MYRSATIEDTLRRLNRSYFLPAIQRPYVWDPEDICHLFDSLMRGYPISSFLFWDVREHNRNNWSIYKFVSNFRYGDVHNEHASPSGDDLILILDGQQRLTSLLIGLCGSYKVKQKHKRRSNEAAYTETKLYMNLLSGINQVDGSGEGNYEFRFFSAAPGDDNNHIWCRVGIILSYDSSDKLDRFKDEIEDRLIGGISVTDRKRIRNNIDRLYSVVWKDQIICYYTESNQDYDRVVDIFIRANDAGRKLSKSDLLLSLMTSSWTSQNAREDIMDFVGHLNDQLEKKNDFSKDFVLRACLVATGLDCAYQIKNFTSANLLLIEQQWQEIKRAVEATVRLVNRFGLDRDTLTGDNALMPIIYYMKRTRHGLRSRTEFELRNAERIRLWLTGALLGSLFTGWADIVLRKSRELVKEALDDSDDFPVERMVRTLSIRGKEEMYTEPFFSFVM